MSEGRGYHVELGGYVLGDCDYRRSARVIGRRRNSDQHSLCAIRYFYHSGADRVFHRSKTGRLTGQRVDGRRYIYTVTVGKPSTLTAVCADVPQVFINGLRGKIETFTADMF